MSNLRMSFSSSTNKGRNGQSVHLSTAFAILALSGVAITLLKI